jgi:glycosyltransferase involved in cell wall biosynthesis
LPLPLSVVLIAREASAQLPQCLASVAFAEEIVVVTTQGDEGTAREAARLGARVVTKDWLGFGRQKQFAVEQAANDWVLCLDADERVTPELARSIRHALEAPAAPVYRMARRNRFLGRWLRHGEGYPDWSPRLFDRRAARWSDDEVHEKVLYGAHPGTLAGDLLHDSAEDLGRYIEKQNRYSALAARALYARGRRAGALELVVSPALRFVKFYLLRLGFLDGVPGLVHVAIGCMASFVKYAKLIELHRLAR